MTGPKFERGGVRGRGWLPQLLPQPEAKSRKGRREPELSVTRPVAQLSDKSRVNSSSYRNEALASHGGSQVPVSAEKKQRWDEAKKVFLKGFPSESGQCCFFPTHNTDSGRQGASVVFPLRIAIAREAIAREAS